MYEVLLYHNWGRILEDEGQCVAALKCYQISAKRFNKEELAPYYDSVFRAGCDAEERCGTRKEKITKRDWWLWYQFQPDPKFEQLRMFGYDDERIKAEAFIMHAFEVIGMEPPQNV